MEEYLDYIFHPEHPLSLTKEARLDKSGNGVVCHVCNTPIGDVNSSPFYECRTCKLYLHKVCAERGRHPTHPEHYMILTKEARLDESGNGVVCYGCNTSIGDVNSSPFYECAPCKFYLHKRCAEVPLEIIYSKHTSQHPLSLFHEQPYVGSSACTCDVCHRNDWEWFTYFCTRCRFSVCIICAFKDMEIDDNNDDENRSLKHEGHQHSLTLQQRPVLLHCDACQTKGEDYSYSCSTCNFWIHKKCALLPKTIHLITHQEHSLDLAYSFPEWYLNYKFYCEICGKLVYHTDWMYYCGPCRYFVHLNCAVVTLNADPEIQSDYRNNENLEIFSNNGDRSARLIKEFVEKMLLEDSDSDFDVDENVKIHHGQPLILWDDQSNKSEIVHDGMLCAACMLPITSPFYHCSHSECSYYIHSYCARLPAELPRHEAHPNHPLKLIKGTFESKLNYLYCELCKQSSSGFFYYCDICRVVIDIRCISFPTQIQHSSHRHPLITTSQPDYRCKACNRRSSGTLYQCETCPYAMDFGCAARYPHTLTHEYDEHDIYLTYPPIENPSDFFCEICEKEIHPKVWMYCCKLCRFYFHLDCLYDRFLYIKFGKTFQVSDHPHLLTFVRSTSNKYSPCLCEDCGEDQENLPIFECKECVFAVCNECVPNRIESRDEEDDGDDPYFNVKFGQKYEVNDHPHLLTFVRNYGGNNSPCLCEVCGKDQKGTPVFKCKECGFTLCSLCGNERIKSTDEDDDGDDPK